MSLIHVAVAAIVNSDNEVLIALRPDHVHQGGKWEFPGGKLEDDEDVFDALKREIKEELNINVEEASPLIKIKHHYDDKSVLLDVWRIDRYSGDPAGIEGQPIRWLKIDELMPDEFPIANRPIIRALQLPEYYMITGSFRDQEDLQTKLMLALKSTPKIVQLRCKHLGDDNEYLAYAKLAKKICQDFGAKLLLNTTLDNFLQAETDGLHLNSGLLFEYSSRPVSEDKLLSVSCHNQCEIDQAKKLNADILLLSPVKETTSHPGVPGIGWDKFSAMVDDINCPVYALGGMGTNDLEMAKSSGAQGIAAISYFWSNEK